MKYAPFIMLLVFLMTSVCVAQPAKDVVVSEVLRVDEFLGKSAEIITKAFGEPDDVGVDAEVWTYVLRSPADENVVLGYRQFGFWGDAVAGYAVRWFKAEDEAIEIFTETLSHLGADGHTVMSIARHEDSPFSDNLKMARRGDNLWYADRASFADESFVTMLVAGMHYKGGHWLMVAEGQRIEQRLGM